LVNKQRLMLRKQRKNMLLPVPKKLKKQQLELLD
jgi:hypothetical protein